MRQSRGVIDYVGTGGQLRGREEWLLSVRRDGSRTMRAQCAMWDTGVSRDVIHTVSAAFRPLRSFVTQDVDGVFLGEGWFSFGRDRVEAAVALAGSGRIDQRAALDRPPPFFVPHAVSCDSWILASYDLSGPRTQVLVGGWRSSPRPDGASGPMAEAMPPVSVTLLGEVTLQVPAGTFATRRFVLEQPNGTRDELWVDVDDGDWLLVQLRCDVLGSSYRLAELIRGASDKRLLRSAGRKLTEIDPGDDGTTGH